MVKTLHARAAATDNDIEDYDGGAEPNMKFSHALIVVLILHILAVGGVIGFNFFKDRHTGANRAKPAAAQQAAAPEAEAPATSAAATALAAAPKAADKAGASDASTTYIVVAGDTLSRIATAHKTSVEAIEKANNIASTSAIRVGQTIKIPAKSAAAKSEAPTAKTAEAKPSPAAKAVDTKTAATAKTAAAEPAKADAKPESSDKSYVVAKGDNPYSIAKKFKISYSELLKINHIDDPKLLQIGQKLIIP